MNSDNDYFFFLMLNIGRGMNSVPFRINSTGGNYRVGAGFDATTWLETISVYQSEIDKEGKCTICRLAELCNISPSSANKARCYSVKETRTTEEGVGFKLWIDV